MIGLPSLKIMIVAAGISKNGGAFRKASPNLGMTDRKDPIARFGGAGSATADITQNGDATRLDIASPKIGMRSAKIDCCSILRNGDAR